MLDFNDQFTYAYEMMENSDKPLFITGKAGTGKSTLLKHFIENTKKKAVILAPTGVAALNVNGQTIHRFFNFNIDVTPQKVRDKKVKPRNAKLYKNLKTIIIDEISMVRADIIDCIDEFLRLYAGNPAKRFGGVQLILFGDLYQLPPVVTRDEKSIFENHYSSPYFFSAFAMEEYPLEFYELERVYRQKDPTFITLLNKIRNNSVSSGDLEHLNTRVGIRQTNGFHIHLTTTNKKADTINETELAALPAKMTVSKAIISGDFGKEYYPTSDELGFKIGAQVMLLNNDSKQRWVNGSVGVIEAVKKSLDGEMSLAVRLEEGGEKVYVTRHTWDVVKFKASAEFGMESETAGTFTQFPIRLAWAVTIHKSQGKTFENVTLDVGDGAFATGQMYVALSRCTSFEGITLVSPMQGRHIQTDPKIYHYLTDIRKERAALEQGVDNKIAIITKALEGQKLLEMHYLQANDSQSTRTIRPVSLGSQRYQGKEYMGLKAFCFELQQEKMFAVDRILKVSEVV